LRSRYFEDWKEVEHPQLGTVEVGGFKFKKNFQNPPPSSASLASVRRRWRRLVAHALTSPPAAAAVLEGEVRKITSW
jgi:hypothetical protein